jgi:hypothetical protein
MSHWPRRGTARTATEGMILYSRGTAVYPPTKELESHFWPRRGTARTATEGVILYSRGTPTTHDP